MFYAYVHYPADKEKAIMPVCLIKDYNPKTETDIPSEPVQAYWRSEAGLEEGYYEAKVVLLAKSKRALLEEMAHKKRLVIPQIFEEPVQASTSGSASNKNLKQRKALAKRKQMASILSKKRPLAGDSTDDEDPAVVPKSELDRAEEALRSLRKRLRKAEEKACATCAEGVVSKAEHDAALGKIEQLQKKLKEVEDSNFRLMRVVLDKIEITREASHQATHQLQGRTSVPAAPIPVPVPVPVSVPVAAPVPVPVAAPVPVPVAAPVLVPVAVPTSVPDRVMTEAGCVSTMLYRTTGASGSTQELTDSEECSHLQPAGNLSPLPVEATESEEVLPAEPHSDAGAAGCGESGDVPYPPLLAVLDGQVHLGHGITLAEATMTHALTHASTPGRFVRMVS
ncbi:stress response protein nst1-like isoform X1 [Ixodes scapularis]|uniref:stress response protein nst1-like isoform X1 n=2 Tax=Ixodes scapularis TaxID=6945 RepID=UPI001A9E508B|nr:stress response protein nst1-like isoform X1 [Ixodes scapularis]